MQTGVAKGLKVPCLFMIAEVSIRCQKKPGGWYTAYTSVYPPIHHCPSVTYSAYRHTIFFFSSFLSSPLPLFTKQQNW